MHGGVLLTALGRRRCVRFHLFAPRVCALLMCHKCRPKPHNIALQMCFDSASSKITSVCSVACLLAVPVCVRVCVRACVYFGGMQYYLQFGDTRAPSLLHLDVDGTSQLVTPCHTLSTTQSTQSPRLNRPFERACAIG